VRRELEHPRISILMPSRGRSERLLHATRAIIDQDYDDWELVIQESADTPATRLPDDPRIVHLREEDRNISHALNIAMRRATGDILHYACDDDELLPGALRTVGAQMGDAMWLRALVQFVDENGGELFVADGRPWDLRSLQRWNWMPQPGVFWRRRAAQAIGEFDESVPLASDYEYWLRLATRWEPRTIDAVVARYYVHGESASRRFRTAQREQEELIVARYRTGRAAALDRRVDRLSRWCRDTTMQARLWVARRRAARQDRAASRG